MSGSWQAWRWGAVVAIWAVVVLAGLAYLVVYEGTPGNDGPAPHAMPAKAVAKSEDALPTLIMFAHPQCPCTRASMGELSVLMARNQGKVTAKVLFVRPAGMTEDWTQTDLWRSAAAIPGVTVGIDEGGQIAARFNVETSGAVVLYDADGKLMFQGGITEGRGHAGDNEGRDAVAALLKGEKPENVTMPAFGCALMSGNSATASPVWSLR